MKIVNLCKITDEYVEIGEEDNTCILTKSEWEVLKEKILDKEI